MNVTQTIQKTLLTSLLITDWLKQPLIWTGEEKSVLLEVPSIVPIPTIPLDTVIEKSSKFSNPFPIETVRCKHLLNKTDPNILQNNINSAYPVIHEYGLWLCSMFLIHQRNDITNGEFYKNLTLIQFIDRLLSKRALSFVGAEDYWQLVTGEKGVGQWETIGTTQNTEPLTLEHCLSYDELKLSALLSVSSESFFINDGDRNNQGIYESSRDKIEENGVIIGVIGARLEKSNVMEFREVMKTKEQNVEENGYGGSEPHSLQWKFLDFYEGLTDVYDKIYNEIKSNSERYIDLGSNSYFDIEVYKKRLAFSIDTLLIDANQRAKNLGTRAYIHVVGFGLGVWEITEEQDQIFMDTFAERLILFNGTLINVSDVRFSYISAKTTGPFKDGDKINNITLHMVNLNPQIKLQGEDDGKLLVVSYAWDGNAHPGNEFWSGDLNGSGDPAAASSSQISELHNWHINDKVAGENLKIATFNGLLAFEDYQEMHRND